MITILTVVALTALGILAAAHTYAIKKAYERHVELMGYVSRQAEYVHDLEQRSATARKLLSEEISNLHEIIGMSRYDSETGNRVSIIEEIKRLSKEVL